MFHGISAALYFFIQEEGFLILPSRETIMNYTGSFKGNVGITELIVKRLEMEAEHLKQEAACII